MTVKFLTIAGEADTSTAASQQLALGLGTAPGVAGLQIGTGGKFNVDGNGNILSINNVPYSWPSAQGSAGQVLTDDGTGVLTWASVSGAISGLSAGFIPQAASATTLTNSLIFASGSSIGIGTILPGGKLHVKTGTDQNFILTPHISLSDGYVVRSMSDSGSLWKSIEVRATDILVNSVDGGGAAHTAIFAQGSTSNVGIGTTSPGQKLDVSGTVQMTGFKLTTAPSAGFVLTSDGSGVGTWVAAASGIGGSGTTGKIPKFTGSAAIGDSLLSESGGNINLTGGNFVETFNTNAATYVQVNNTSAGATAQSIFSAINGAGNFCNVGVTGSGYTPVVTWDRQNVAYLNTSSPAGISIASRDAAGIITFHTGGNAEKVRIDAAGNVGIGISPVTKLQVKVGTDINFGVQTGGFTSGLLTHAFNDAVSVNIPHEIRGTDLLLQSMSAGATNSTRIFLQSSTGFVGVNTLTPLSAFDVKAGTDQHLAVTPFVQLGSGVALQSSNDAGNLNVHLELRARDLMLTSSDIGGGAGGSIIFTRNPTESMRIDPSGNLGIGTTSPTDPLNINVDGSALNTTFESHGTSTGPRILLYSSRGTRASPTATQSGDTIGRWGFRGYGTSPQTQAQILAFATETWTGSVRGTRIDFQSTATGGTGVTTGLTVLGSRVGIAGVTNPGSELDVAGAVQMTGFKLTTTPTAGYVLTSDVTGVGSWQQAVSGTGTTGQLTKFTGAGTIGDSIVAEAAGAITVSGNETVSGRLLGASASITAANDLTLGATNFNVVAGSTTINALLTAGWTAGSAVTLKFSGAPLVKHNTAGGAGTAVMFLAASLDFQAAADSILGLVYDGTQWHETFRKVA